MQAVVSRVSLRSSQFVSIGIIQRKQKQWEKQIATKPNECTWNVAFHLRYWIVKREGYSMVSYIFNFISVEMSVCACIFECITWLAFAENITSDLITARWMDRYHRKKTQFETRKHTIDQSATKKHKIIIKIPWILNYYYAMHAFKE